ncbi:Imm52 family immunity protein [Xenorhabdus bovienii]|uniref:Imm52 family immunity protein n=1 Tax=Xenorhabdus bovienii TaxID=40576 RepID=UPI0023B2C485|nr:Imm52 family immunity protein [Xenorhabdus bovienii]MDE9535989.1 immunity 52 family protein [Xenorhabdus bovienii]MDE9588946.1 immunity 52 family protein [Xenorhabdus bovienii]
MSEISLRVVIKEKVTEEFPALIDALHFFLNEINKCDKRITAFYSQGETLEEALENKIIDVNGFINPDSKNLIGKYLPVVEGVWDGNEDNSMSILFMKNDETSSVLVSAENHIGIYNKDNLIKFINSVSEKYTLQLFSVSFNGSGVGEAVFPDRPPAGWMLYLPFQFEMHPSLLKTGAEFIPLSTPLSTGTIIISKDDYNCMDKADQYLSNDIEIALRDLGILPLYSDIYKNK